MAFSVISRPVYLNESNIIGRYTVRVNRQEISLTKARIHKLTNGRECLLRTNEI